MTTSNEAKPSAITFTNVIPDHLTDCFVSGFYGGIAPSGKIYFHFFSERPAIPKKETREILPNGTLGKRLGPDNSRDIVRLIESSIVLDLPTAKEMARWLQHHIDLLENRIKAQTSAPQTPTDGNPVLHS